MAYVRDPVFTPDVLEGPSGSDLAQLSGRPSDERGGLPSNAQAIRLQLTAVQIADGLQGGFLGLGPATGVYVVTNVVDGAGDKPINFSGNTYRDVRNGDLLPIGPPNDLLTVYFKKAPLPDILSVNVLVLRSNADMRELGSVISQIEGDDTFKKLNDVLLTALTATQPAFGVVAQVAVEAMGLLGTYLQSKKDDQLGYLQHTYTNLFDSLGQGNHPPDGPSEAVDKVRLGYEIEVI
jgi:hypothetical protein